MSICQKKLLQLVKDFSKTTYKDIYTEKSSQALGIPKNATLAQLDKIASTATGAKRERAHYLRNMRRGRQKNEGLNEGYKLQLERGDDMDVLHIYDTKLKQRTEVL